MKTCRYNKGKGTGLKTRHYIRHNGGAVKTYRYQVKGTGLETRHYVCRGGGAGAR